jgi:hypothetical protein
MATEDAPDDGLLRRYVLGLTSAEETEQFDQRSVTDDEFAVRLEAIEYDLVDAYAAGTLPDDLRQAFLATYLASGDGRAEIDFAQTLPGHRAQGRRARSSLTPGRPATAGGRWWQAAIVPRWTLVAAALILLAVSGYLLTENQRLRRDVQGAHAERATLDAQTRALQQQLDARQLLTDSGRGAATAPAVIASFILPPGFRGAGETPTITLPPDADQVRLTLPLGTVRVASFSAALRDASSNQIVWRGSDLHALNGRTTRTVTITIPASMLKPRTYLIELQGTRADGASATLSPYACEVVAP